MELMNMRVHKTLRAAGAPDKEAQECAIAFAELDTRLIKLEAGHRVTRYLVGLNIILTLLSGFGLLKIIGK